MKAPSQPPRGEEKNHPNGKPLSFYLRPLTTKKMKNETSHSSFFYSSFYSPLPISPLSGELEVSRGWG